MGEKKEKSSSLITGYEFNNKIPSEATSVAFTDEVAPEGASTTDLTVAKDGGVVGWLDGTTWKVSTQDSSKVVNFNEVSSYMFFNKDDLTNIDFNNVDTSNVTYMDYMFYGRSKLTSLDLSSFNTSKVTNMAKMFGASNLTSLDLSNFNTYNITDMHSMFSSCSSLTSLDLSSFNTSNVTNMSGMFYGCRNLSSINLHNWYIASGTDVTCMFGWTNITPGDVPYLDISRVDKELMFSN